MFSSYRGGLAIAMYIATTSQYVDTTMVNLQVVTKLTKSLPYLTKL